MRMSFGGGVLEMHCVYALRTEGTHGDGSWAMRRMKGRWREGVDPDSQAGRLPPHHAVPAAQLRRAIGRYDPLPNLLHIGFEEARWAYGRPDTQLRLVHIRDWHDAAWYPVVIIVSAILTVGYVRVWPPPGATLLVADALGLALFALSGAQLAEAAQCPPLIVVLIGTMTGVTGGVLRDVITAQVPLILRREIYATAAIVGVAVYLALQALEMPRPLAFGAGMIVVVALRLLAIRWGLHLPVFRRF